MIYTFYRPKRSFGQGNIFTSVCLSTGGGCLLQIFGGVSAPNFRGGVPAPNFRGGVCSKFSGGCLLQIFRGVSAPNFRGGCLLQIFGGVSAPNFRGGCLLQIFGGVSAPNFQGGTCSKFSGGVSDFWNTVNVRPVRILLECILVHHSLTLINQNNSARAKENYLIWSQCEFYHFKDLFWWSL